ncbi:extracellular calcium-sensing receptor [Hydra vulgaris]|uniref:Extracellular calcium-sensing receptor n=1 Tax=Hydra vulgaris TaxID=6087 RepID=A0ABM4BLM6_HYDVU
MSSRCKRFLVFKTLLLFLPPLTGYSGCTENIIEFSDIDNASVIIGGLFPVHYWHQNYKKYVLNKPGLLWVEAMIFAIDEINKSSFLKNKKIGYRIRDSCNNIKIAIKSALEITQSFHQYRTIVNNSICQCNLRFKKAIALVGDAASDTSTNVAAILSSTGTTQISYSATSTDLNAKLYRSFLRTILPDNIQAALITDLMVYNNWTFINVIACDDDYGRVGFSELLPRLQEKGVCTAVAEICDVKGDSNTDKIKILIKKLLLEKKANIIVLWCQRPEAVRFLKVAAELNLYNKTWIATETYGFSNEVYDINPNVVKGMLGIIPLQVFYEPFETKLKSLSPNLIYKNPWVHEYWKEKNCETSNVANCSNLSLFDLPKSKYAEVIHAVQSIARGLNSYIELENPSELNPQRLLSYVKNASFIGINNLLISYDEQGNPRAAGYSITNLKTDNNKKLFWDVIAIWDFLSRKITFNPGKQITYPGDSVNSLQSSCKEKCKPGYFALLFESLCCWECVKCPKDSIQPNFGQFNCTRCTKSKIPNAIGTKCVLPKKVFIFADSKEGVIIINFSTFGCVLVIFVVFTFYRYKETPIVKASNINLSLTQLISILFTLMLPSFCVQKEITKQICFSQLLYFACFNTITVSVTFIKADFLLRIFSKSRSIRFKSKTNAHSTQYYVRIIVREFMPVAVLTFISVTLCIISLFSFPIEVNSVLTIQRDDNIQTISYCDGYYNSILFLMITFVVLIAFVCGVYAFKARNMPDTHNEAQLTCLATFLYVISWLIFIPLYLSTSNQQQKLVVWCLMSNTSTICLFLVVYSPKIYFIFFRARENTGVSFRAKITHFMFTNLAFEP